ncbi:MAG TPA: retropepsin-like aspartic protease [Methylibium sp.]|nr:retropepsin-like aspartic protease [Methylibium sp.]
MRAPLAGCVASLLVAAGAALAQGAPADPAAGARRVAFSGSIGERQALLVIDGGPRSLAVGETWRGVRLLSLAGGDAVVEVDGQRRTLRLGGAAVNLGGVASPGSGRVVKLSSDANGHFLANGQINGLGVSFLVDTGATLVAIGRDEADRLGLDYKSGRRVGLTTANGTAIGYRVSLSSVRLGDVDIYNVEAVIQPQPMPFILLGNSFLTRFQMRRENDVLTLERRY